MTYKLEMVDLSSNNGPVNLDALWNAGHRILALKVTEGTKYAWSGSHDLARRWHAKGGLVAHYHFLVPGNAASGVTQADFFWKNVKGDLGVGDILVVDAETNGESASEVAAFIERTHSHAPQHRGLVYGTAYFLRDNGIRPRCNWRLWVASYGSKPAFTPPGWKTWTIWQFTQTGRVSGVSGNVDVSKIMPSVLRPTLRYRDKSWSVVLLKTSLRQAGYKGIKVSSQRYGLGLRRAVAAFKKKHKFKNTDGRIAGGHVWQALKH
jgi:lysozyme